MRGMALTISYLSIFRPDEAPVKTLVGG